ncbi:MAG TPA: BatD family protein [Kofleriaceae bacterium]|nr:BatD family protein [Kofleriaceae bacterium]
MRTISLPLALAITAVMAVTAVTAGTARADEPEAEFRLADRDTPHVEVPFDLDLVIEGLDETPQPDAPKLEIAGAQVALVGVSPNVQRGIQIINGRRSDFVKVTWVIRWRITPHKEGRLRIPSLTVTQGGKRVTARAAEAEVDTIPVSDAMKLSLALPERPIFVGETVPVTLSWMFRSQPQTDPKWSIPMMTMDAFTVSGPPANGSRKVLEFPAGGKQLQLPYEIDQVDQGGARVNRVSVTFFLAPRKVGKIEVPASSVVAALQTGRADFFGNAPSRLFRATDVPRVIEVKPLPETDKPASFAGAVGEQFSIDVQTSRSVVKLGEPVELAIRIKSNQRLDTLALGKLDGEGGLPKDKFVVPADPPTGELSEDGKAKTFKVTAQVTGPATEVPAIAFSYFDPARGTYQTIHSEPIALSVAGSSVVSAGDVVAARPRPAAQGAQGAVVSPELEAALVDAELALSAPGAEQDRPLGGAALWLLVGLLYAVPIALLVARSWQLRTAGQREEAAEVRAARRRVEELLDRSASAPARDVAGPLAAALRDLARLLGRAIDDGGLLAKLETESFSQGASTVPLSADLRSDAAGLLRRWTAEARRRRKRPGKHPGSSVTAAAVFLAALGASTHASAAPANAATAAAGASSAASAASAASGDPGAPTAHDTSALAEGRATYQDAMQLTGNATARKAAFARAATALGEAARAMPDRPELLTDWGNAALQAGDVATATLAYRRALAIDGGNPRARHNLAWLRSRQPDAFRPPAGGAADTLLFFHGWPRARKLLVGSAAFALAILLVVPWSGRRRRGWFGLALLPRAVWLAMLASVVLEDRHPDDAIVMDAVVLRAADSAGAPSALSQPLPRGVEVTVLERRDAWTRIRLAGGTAGWVQTGAVERIAR